MLAATAREVTWPDVAMVAVCAVALVAVLWIMWKD